MTDETVKLEDGTSPSVAPIQILDFDPVLVAKWFEIPPEEPLNIELPRATLDMLYDGINKGHEVQLEILAALQRLALGESYDVAAFNQKVAPVLASGMNSIRRFQTVIMALATGSTLDADLKVIQEASDGGE